MLAAACVLVCDARQRTSPGYVASYMCAARLRCVNTCTMSGLPKRNDASLALNTESKSTGLSFQPLKIALRSSYMPANSAT